ncbi:MAG TPA: tyrosine-type recombinase/integrase [Kofleriaceae bacterium]|nr:tyrosine-type recombinase/integrase [Kofleriaceae bacterium]
MRSAFASPLASELAAFLAFKRAHGYRYARAEFMLRSFDRFLESRARRRHTWRLDETILAWLASRPARKAISVAMDLAVIREFWRYLHRRDPRRFARQPHWPRLPTEPRFLACVLSLEHVRLLLRLVGRLDRPRFRRSLYRALILLLYCTGIRVGEALRLRIRDLDLVQRVLFVGESKGRSRWVPFHPSLAVELKRYLRARRAFVGFDAAPDDRVFVGANRRQLAISTAGGTFCTLYRSAGLKPARGRLGPRPYDLRHTFAVHRLTRWYRQGVDLHRRLPWLSAYLGHVDLLGTETYLTATPELLALAADRFRRRYSRNRRTA